MYKYEEEINERIKNFDYKQVMRDYYHEEWPDPFIIIRSFFQYQMSPNAIAALKKHYTFTKNGVVRNTENKRNNKFNLPTLEIPCAICNTHEKGLYCIGTIGCNPEGKKYYLLKVGCSEDIGNRMTAYYSSNPMIYSNNMVLTDIPDDMSLRDAETNCHKFLANFAFAIAQKCHEWFYFTEEDYFMLCDMFNDKETFKMIASGEMKVA